MSIRDDIQYRTGKVVAQIDKWRPKTYKTAAHKNTRSTRLTAPHNCGGCLSE